MHSNFITLPLAAIFALMIAERVIHNWGAVLSAYAPV